MKVLEVKPVNSERGMGFAFHITFGNRYLTEYLFIFIPSPTDYTTVVKKIKKPETFLSVLETISSGQN